MKKFLIKGKVNVFPQKGGWYYIHVPKKHTELLQPFAERGLVPIIVTVGKSTWKTSLLPMGDGTQFIAIKGSIRKAEGIDFGSTITLTYTLRI